MHVSCGYCACPRSRHATTQPFHFALAPAQWRAWPRDSAHAEPLATRNQHPLVALYGLPLPLAARLPGAGSGRIGANVNWSNFATTDTTDHVSYTLDGEVFEARVQAEHALGEASPCTANWHGGN